MTSQIYVILLELQVAMHHPKKTQKSPDYPPPPKEKDFTKKNCKQKY